MFQSLVQGFKTLVQRPADNWDYSERRKLIRLRCEYRCLIEIQGKNHEAVILDMGLGGLRLRSYQPCKVGDTLQILSPFNEIGDSNEPVLCQVQWVQQSNKSFHNYLGVKYISDNKAMARTWVRGVLKQLGFRPEFITSKRRWVRADHILEGTLKRPDNNRHEILVHNLGIGGALFEYRNALPLGDSEIRVGPYEGLPAMDLQGVLVKARPQGRHYLYGLQFENLNASQLRMLGVYLKHLLTNSWEV